MTPISPHDIDESRLSRIGGYIHVRRCSGAVLALLASGFLECTIKHSKALSIVRCVSKVLVAPGFLAATSVFVRLESNAG